VSVPLALVLDRADAIGLVLGEPEDADVRRAADHCEEDRMLRAELVGMLPEADRGR
jgi:hypothetical protein